MPFRNVIISERCKLEYSLNYLICKKADEEKRVLLDEIKTIVIQSNQVAITTALITMISKKKIKLIFCDEKYNPECELVSYQNNFYSYRKIKEQIDFVNNQDEIWQAIVKKKIFNQAKNLLYLNKKEEYELLINYYNDVKLNDISNREGHSAKVYFNALFGTDFNRNQSNCINTFLNYGYSILLSSINREVKSLGYLTELGIHHIGESNPFNLSCDLIEHLRPLVDYYVITDKVNLENYKIGFVKMLSQEVMYNNQKIFLDNAIHLFVVDIMNKLKEKNAENLKFIEYEL